MSTPQCRQADRHLQSRRFLALYTLAAAGGSAAYTPFVTLFLPSHVTAIWGGDGVRILSYLWFTGAIAASAANILFGWASDRTCHRRVWIVAGLVCSSIMLVAMQSIGTFSELILAIVLWQVALNMMLGPLGALAGDCIPDAQKGTLGGLLSIAPAVGALTGALVTIPGLIAPGLRLAMVACLVGAMVLPVVLFGNPRPMPQLMRDSPSANSADPEPANPYRQGTITSAVWRMWLARLLIHIADASLFGFFLLWMQGLSARSTQNTVAMAFTGVLFVSVPLALAIGRWSDRVGRPTQPLVLAAGASAVGLTVMAAAPDPVTGIAGYALFGVTTSVFLALHASQTLRVLPRPSTRGRDLGIFNLTNTVPSLIVPWVAVLIIPVFGFTGFFALLAVIVSLAALLLATGPRGPRRISGRTAP